MEIFTIDSMNNNYYFYPTDGSQPIARDPFLRELQKINKSFNNNIKVLRFDNEVFRGLKREFPNAYILLKDKCTLFSDLLRFYLGYKWDKDEIGLYIDSDVVIDENGIKNIKNTFKKNKSPFFRGSGILVLDKNSKNQYLKLINYINNLNLYSSDIDAIIKCNLKHEDIQEGCWHFSNLVFPGSSLNEHFLSFINAHPNEADLLKRFKSF